MSYLLSILFVACTASASFVAFKCSRNFGTNPTTGLLPMIQSFGVLQPTKVPTLIGVSAIQCAAFCARSPLEACQSYSYNPVTMHCFTKNIRADYSGYLCGINIDQSQKRCQQFGNTMIAYGGTKSRMVECICGGDSNSWLDVADFSYKTDACPGACKNSYPCGLDLYPDGRCRVCNGTISACNGVPPKGSAVSRIICMTLPL